MSKEDGERVKGKQACIKCKSSDPRNQTALSLGTAALVRATLDQMKLQNITI